MILYIYIYIYIYVCVCILYISSVYITMCSVHASFAHIV